MVKKLEKVALYTLLIFLACFLYYRVFEWNACQGISPKKAIQMTMPGAIETVRADQFGYRQKGIRPEQLVPVYRPDKSDDEVVWIDYMVNGKEIFSMPVFHDCDIETWGSADPDTLVAAPTP